MQNHCCSRSNIRLDSPEVVRLKYFNAFLESKGENIWVNYKDWAVMPNKKRQEIMTTFASTKMLRITTTSSFPHHWSFTGIDYREKEKIIKCIGPSAHFYKE